MNLKLCFQNLKIRQKLILVFLPIPLLGIVTIGSFWYWNALKAVEKSLQEQTSILAENASLLVENYLNEREVEIKSASQLGWIVDFFVEANEKTPPSADFQNRLRQLLIDLGAGPFQITCADSNGILFARAQLTSFLPRDKLPVHFETRFFNNQDLIGIRESLAANADRVFVSNVKSIRGSKALIFSTPVWNNKTAGRLGIIAFCVAIARIADEIETQSLGHESQAMILDKGGEVLYHTDRRKVNQNISAVMPFFVHDFDFMPTAKQASRTFQDEQNERWIISATSVKKTGWAIAISSPVKPFIQPTQRAGLFGIAASIGVSILLLFLIHRFSKEFVTDISEVTEGARAVASGDLNRQLPVRTGDEIGELAKDFNKMSANLQRLIRERQANETLVTIGRFSSALAHDLRNPIEGMKLLSSELKKRMSGSDSAYEVADAISQSAENLSTLVNQSLDFARLNQPDFAPMNLATLANELLADFHFERVELKRDYADDLPNVEVDAAQIKRVLANLVRNALDACLANRNHERNEITLTLKGRGEKMIVEVADTGVGIPPESGKKIFEPFFTTKAGGHGLGLALVRQIIANHSGTIAFKSEDGQGTRFVIELPIVQSSHSESLKLSHSLKNRLKI
ncbi:MAG: ATP-binding protein [bacterium]